MHVRVNNFDFAIGECVLERVQKHGQYTGLLDPFLMTVRHTYRGEVLPDNGLGAGASQDQIRVRLAEIENALNQSILTAGVVDDNGSLVHALDRTTFDGSIVGGLRGIRLIGGLSHGLRDASEGLTGREFTFTLEADYSKYNTAFYTYTETFSWNGDTGPEFFGVLLDTGEADIQQIRERTIQTIVQQGNAVGIGSYPQFPPPIYPNLKRAAPPVVSQQAAIRRGSTQHLYPITWRYAMLSTVNQFGS